MDTKWQRRGFEVATNWFRNKVATKCLRRVYEKKTAYLAFRVLRAEPQQEDLLPVACERLRRGAAALLPDLGRAVVLDGLRFGVPVQKGVCSVKLCVCVGRRT